MMMDFCILHIVVKIHLDYIYKKNLKYLKLIYDKY